MPIQAFMATYITRALCLVSKKQRIDPKVPANFDEACEYSVCRASIDREFNVFVSRGTWTYVKLESSINQSHSLWYSKRNRSTAKEISRITPVAAYEMIVRKPK